LTTAYEKFSYLDVSVSEGVATIYINRPEKSNACDEVGHRELATILRVIQCDDSVRAAVITGRGPTFSVGGDIALVQAIHSSPAVAIRTMREARELIQSHIECDKPIVAAINGVGMGASLAFALLCDYIVIERGVNIADGHIRAALSAGDGGTMIWPLTMGLTKAKRFLMTGDSIDAEEAERLGLVTEVVSSDRSLQRATQVARRFADGPQTAIRNTKMALNQWLRLAQTTSFDFSLALEFLSAVDEDVPRALQELRNRRVGAMPIDQHLE
jgi:enoyl-CoA hydratase